MSATARADSTARGGERLEVEHGLFRVIAMGVGEGTGLPREAATRAAGKALRRHHMSKASVGQKSTAGEGAGRARIEAWLFGTRFART